ncbi:MAG: hypothetical protein FWG85_06785 [Bacteroidetes bacterium]|nr:hypothetical protein [Bacteroidota bacterium]
MDNCRLNLNGCKILLLFCICILLCGCRTNNKESINDFIIGKWMCFDEEAVGYLTFNKDKTFAGEYFSLEISGTFHGIYSINTNKMILKLEYNNGNVRTEFIVYGKDAEGDYFFTYIDDEAHQIAINNNTKYRRTE